MTRQQERRSVAERREQLIDAAISVLAREGIGAATTRRITAEAGLALGAFHYAFRNKDELLRAVAERLSRGVEGVLESSPADPTASLTAFGEQIVQAFWGFVEQTTELQLAQYELTVHALRDPGLKPLAEEQYRRLTAAVDGALEGHPEVPDGQARHDLASYLVSVMDGLILHRVVEGDADAAVRRLELFVATLPALADRVRRQRDGNPVATG